MSSFVSIYMIQMHEQSWTYVSENAPCASSEGISWGMMNWRLRILGFSKKDDDSCWNGRIYLSLDEKIEKAAGLDFFGRGLNNGRNINRPKNLFFFCCLEEDFSVENAPAWGFCWLVWIGVLQRGRELDQDFMWRGRSRTMYLVAYYGHVNLYEYSYYYIYIEIYTHNSF